MHGKGQWQEAADVWNLALQKGFAGKGRANRLDNYEHLRQIPPEAQNDAHLRIFFPNFMYTHEELRKIPIIKALAESPTLSQEFWYKVVIPIAAEIFKNTPRDQPGWFVTQYSQKKIGRAHV